MSVNYSPNLGEYKSMKPFFIWCQKVLPLVYDDSLSYYEVLNKLVNYLNVVIENVDTAEENITLLSDAYDELQGYVNHYFDNLDVQEEINNKLDAMAEDGTLQNLLEPFMSDFESAVEDLENEVLRLQALVGTPLVSSTVSGMTDHDKIYVYTGSETGYTAGNWYYWNGTTWASGGVYNSTAFETDKTLSVEGMAADAKKTGDAINNLTSKVTEELRYISVLLTQGYRYAPGQSVGGNITTSENAQSAYTATPINLTEYVGSTLKIIRSANPSNNARLFGFGTSNGVWVTIFDQRTTNYRELNGKYIAEIPITAPYFYYSDHVSVTQEFRVIGSELETVYVSPNGSDANPGTYDYPYKTVNQALSDGYKNIRLFGGIYEEFINLPEYGEISIAPAEVDKIPVFLNPNRLEIKTASLYSEGIYVCDASMNILSLTPVIFQDGVADVTTEISASDRLPQQRGKTYRCDDTKIIKCVATTLNDAISEMNSASVYKFFYDETNSKLYFTSPDNDFDSHPICEGTDASLFNNLSRNISLKVSGIECKYMRFDISKTINSIISCVKCSCAYASGKGQFVFDDCISPIFYNCEASMSHGASNGDGFNAHARNASDGDVFAHQSGTVIENCWAHDNSDDGYSEHAKGESTIIGGLFEWNGKAGVTPSYGTHCTCIGVISRENYSGFLLTGTANDNGIGGQLLCIDCLAINNLHGGSNNTGSTGLIV